MDETEKTSIENQIFKWKEFDQLGSTCYTFYDCTFIIDLPDYKAGETVAYVNIEYETSVMEVYTDKHQEKPAHKYKLVVSVTPA